MHRIQHHRSERRRRYYQTRRLVAIAQLHEGDQLSSIALRRRRGVAPGSSRLDGSLPPTREDDDGPSAADGMDEDWPETPHDDAMPDLVDSSDDEDGDRSVPDLVDSSDDDDAALATTIDVD